MRAESKSVLSGPHILAPKNPPFPGLLILEIIGFLDHYHGPLK